MRPGTRKLDLLLLEDDPMDIQLFRLAFKRVRQQARSLHVVHDGEEAIDYLCRRGLYAANGYRLPNVIVTDLKMPGMTGFDFLAWLHSHPDCGVIPTIV